MFSNLAILGTACGRSECPFVPARYGTGRAGKFVTRESKTRTRLLSFDCGSDSRPVTSLQEPSFAISPARSSPLAKRTEHRDKGIPSTYRGKAKPVSSSRTCQARTISVLKSARPRKWSIIPICAAVAGLSFQVRISRQHSQFPGRELTETS
ncbi:hypothetical protein M433DRAFT_152484 [Acidomyces richmondensis BFW]|nr:MAG: hypothetical protein FE78DRAFT_87773 [Acidomyces sp. 'richmondensis']KYG47243.1 hypothetical protein M433DRAFT_152484 [Acidomyces richmondensis BFW]